MAQETRGTSKSKKRAALQRLMRRLPEGEALFETLIGLAGPLGQNPLHDRIAAIVGPTYVEHALKQAIAHHLKPDTEDPKHNYLFESDDAPYREFASRIRLARALGVITNEEFRQLEIIRLIRNAFAHAPSNISLETEEIAVYCDDLRSIYERPPSIVVDVFGKKDSLLNIFGGNRRLFVHAVFMLFWKLINYPDPFSSLGLGLSGPPPPSQ